MVILLLILFVVFCAVCLALGFAWPLMWAWNYVIPHITSGHVPEIQFWHAFSLLVLIAFIRGAPSIDFGGKK